MGGEAGTDKDVKDTESDGYIEEATAEPGTRPDVLWGSRPLAVSSQSTNPSEAKALDREATNKLWNAAGYNVEPITEGNEATSALTDTTLTNDDDAEPTEIYQPPAGPYNIRKAHGKGQGVYASQDIPRGTRILVDKPFFVVTKPYNHSTIIDKFDQMSFTRRKQYMQFSCPDRPDDRQMSDVTRIFEANCFNIDYSAAIFQTATRFNHSCLPNTYYSWSEARQEIVFQAMIDVGKDEELTIAYGRPFLSLGERKHELRNYNFKCGCPACQLDTPFGQASESRRLAMKALDEQVILCQTAVNEGLHTLGLPDPLSLIMKLVEIIKEEGLWGELMAPYRGVAELIKGRGDWEKALVFADKQLEEERICLGEDSEVVRKTREYVEELEKMTGRTGLLGEGRDLGKIEMEDLEVLDFETAEHHSKDSHSHTPPEPVNNPPTTYTLEDCPFPKPPSPSPPSPPPPSPSHPNPLLHLPSANEPNSQNPNTLSPTASNVHEPAPASGSDFSAETHENHSFPEQHKDNRSEGDSRSSSPRLVRGGGPGR